MSESPKLFISFSSRDGDEMKKLFSALELQRVNVWDYSREGQELPLAHGLDDVLKEKIDACEYFIAVISPNTIDEDIGRHTRLEVLYAIERRKEQQNRILPLLLNNPDGSWLGLYGEISHVLRDTLDTGSQRRFEATVRKICGWLSVKYVPPSLRDPRVFFAKLFLEEIEGKQLDNSDFIELTRIMNSCATQLLAEDWEGVEEKVSLFLSLAEESVPDAGFYYPLVIRGVCELQRKKFADAEETFLQATEGQDAKSNPLLGLGFAGLGHTYFWLGRYEESLKSFETAVDLLPEDSDVHFNYLGALAHAGGLILDESVLDVYDLLTLAPEEQAKVIALRGAVQYKKGNYKDAIRTFGTVRLDDLDEASAVYYALALQGDWRDGEAIDVLSSAARRIKSINLYHHLANAYLRVNLLEIASTVYEEVLCKVNDPPDLARQLLVEYAQIVRRAGGAGRSRCREACERATDFSLLPPPSSKAGFFFTGFAYHLLGKNDLARHYYDSSSGFSADYYDVIEL